MTHFSSLFSEMKGKPFTRAFKQGEQCETKRKTKSQFTVQYMNVQNLGNDRSLSEVSLIFWNEAEFAVKLFHYYAVFCLPHFGFRQVNM